MGGGGGQKSKTLLLFLIHMFVLPFWSFKHYIEEKNLEETVIFSESPEPWGWVGGVRC